MQPKTIKKMELDVFCTPDSEAYKDCDNCIYRNDDLTECINRRCIHSMLLYDCFEKRSKMTNLENYKLRMVKEYKELKEKYTKLHNMLVKYDAGKLDFTPTCPIDLLRKQASIMGQYLYILETRAVIEDIDLHSED
nr:MAG TPA: hypothetical protein [Caudoviricetes sp.]